MKRARDDLPRGFKSDELLDESAVAARLGCRIADIRRARFHRCGPPYVTEGGRCYYPVRALADWHRRAMGDRRQVEAEALAASAGFEADFTA